MRKEGHFGFSASFYRAFVSSNLPISVLIWYTVGQIAKSVWDTDGAKLLKKVHLQRRHYCFLFPKILSSYFQMESEMLVVFSGPGSDMRSSAWLMLYASLKSRTVVARRNHVQSIVKRYLWTACKLIICLTGQEDQVFQSPKSKKLKIKTWLFCKGIPWKMTLFVAKDTVERWVYRRVKSC